MLLCKVLFFILVCLCSCTDQTKSDYIIHEVKISDISSNLEFSGKLKSDGLDEFGVASSAKIEKVYFKNGASVKVGDLIAELSDSSIEKEIDNYKTDLSTKERALKDAALNVKDQEREVIRQKKLLTKGIISKREFEITKNAFNAAETNYKNVKDSLNAFKKKFNDIKDKQDDLKIKAKRSGELQLTYKGGDTDKDIVLFQVVDLSKFQIELDVNEVDIVKLKLEQNAQVSFDAIQGKALAGKIKSISSQPINMGSQKSQGGDSVVLYRVVVTLTENDPKLKIGMTANVKVALSSKQGTIVIPLAAVQYRGQTTYVLKLNEKKEKIETTVELGIEARAEVEVIKGINSGDRIIIPIAQ